MNTFVKIVWAIELIVRTVIAIGILCGFIYFGVCVVNICLHNNNSGIYADWNYLAKLLKYFIEYNN